MQIGRNCLVDFLGSSATAAAQAAQWLVEFEDALIDASENFGVSGERAIPLVEFLTHVAMSIREFGWTSRGKAYDYGDRATADHASTNLYECRKVGYREPGPKELYTLPTNADAQTAEAAIAWARETYAAKPIEDRDDFEHNMAVATAGDYIVPRRFGLAAYAVQGHRVATEKEVQRKVREKTVATSEFVGAVKDKLTLNVTLLGQRELPGDFGTTYLYTFDADGNQIKWFSSRDVDLEVGTSYSLKGTVKKHDDHPTFGKATILTRCKTTPNS